MTALSTSKRLRYLVLSDVHLGHDKNPARAIVENLYHYFDHFKNTSSFAKIDLICIAGDLLDQLLDAASNAFYEAVEFSSRLRAFCVRHGIVLRILEGTPFHDRRQNRMFNMIASILDTQEGSNKGDVRWVDTLTIERIDALDLTVLYIPDEFTPAASTTLQLVKELLADKGLTQVDIAFMHGVFDFQMRGIPGEHDTHDVNEYLQIVKHFINIGHHHKHSTYLRALAQGSFDRLAHGEEEAKGAMLMTIRDDGEDYYEFIPNTRAKLFRTIELTDEDLPAALQTVRRGLSKIPDESHIRIRAPKLHGIFAALVDLRKEYPTLHFTKQSVEEAQAQVRAHEPLPQDYTVVEIRPANVVELIMGELPELSKTDRAHLGGMLNDLRQAVH